LARKSVTICVANRSTIKASSRSSGRGGVLYALARVRAGAEVRSFPSACSRLPGKPVMVRVQPQQLDDWRRRQDDLPGRPEAIRRLVELGLKAKQKP
jgi:hypothetical protein